jgi:uncharacterized membrane protein
MSFAARFRNYFLAGILVTAPIGITLWLAWKVVGFVDNSVRPLVPSELRPETYLPIDIELPGFGIIVVVAGLVLIGRFTTGIFGKLIVKYSEWLLNRIPVIKSIYGWTRQIFETLLSEESTAFREVVLTEYPCRGSWAVGFITGQTQGEIQDLTTETVFNVFVPATPNPTTGFLLFIPERDIHRLEMSVDDGIKLVISGGIVKPSDEEEEWTWGEGTGIADEVDRIKVQMEENRYRTKHEATWGAGTGIADDVERIKTAMEEERSSKIKVLGPLGKMRDYFFTGTLVTAPIAITIWLALAVVDYFDKSVIPLIPASWNPETYLPFSIPGLGLVTAVLSMTLVGFLTAGILGNAIVRLGERLIEGLPVIRGIYSAVKQIFESLLKKQSSAFREVVLVQYPRPEAWAIGFITGDVAREIEGKTPEEGSVNIFLPTTPNPTSGFLLFLPRAEVHQLAMTVEEGLKMVVSGGIVTPGAPAADATEPTGAADAASDAPSDASGRNDR